ncbi:sugar ABC transporter substrate-binding protein [Paenibacillus whitsoniae]|uniref:Sugar ABC transporter substrate-binding protein n=1 Tax=Paenibacillus whitsoniae TaxID=2496558 RepID=A0A430JHM7_9BACL|nr:substrate-binding domain-containing protein [Paenibacillus whitsoniae]RTE10523.1 sugar ABC transporter substrate-binding protein [Paenibacillus whitsoniae]
MRITSWAACTFLLLLVLTACKDSAPSGPDMSPSASQHPEQTASSNHDRRLTFGIIYPLAHPFYEMITESIEAASKPYPIQLVVKAPDEINLEQQIRMMENMINQKVDGIALDPIDPVALEPYINKAVLAGIPVICFESDVPGSKRSSFIGSSFFNEGMLMGQIVERTLKGKGMIMVEGSKAGSIQQTSRLAGMLEYLKTKTDIQVLETRYNEGNNDNAISDLETLIEEHPHFDALVALDVISSSNAILVWKSQGLKRFALTFGMTPEVKEALLNGQIHSVISENEHMWGNKIIEKLLAGSNHSEVSEITNTGFQEVTQTALEGTY